MADEKNLQDSNSSLPHDEETQDGYKKRCYCQKCVGKYKEWCEKKKGEPHIVCKRKCYTVCQIKCHKEQTTYTDWGYHEKFEGKWEHKDAEHAPHPCESCKKPKNDCSCKKH